MYFPFELQLQRNKKNIGVYIYIYDKKLNKTVIFREIEGNTVFSGADVCRNKMSFSVTFLLSDLFQLQQNNLLNYISMTFNANAVLL